MNEFLNCEIIINFRKIINSTQLFCYSDKYKSEYNLFCAVCDRLDDSIKYLNNHSEIPKKEHDFLVFMMYSCMVLDASKQLLASVKIKNEYSNIENKESYQFFKQSCMSYPLEISEEKCPTDDKFFEYFRSLTFAHPFETNRAKFLDKGETNYSPWVIVYNPCVTPFFKDKNVGVRLYSNKFDEIKDLRISFSTLKDYIASRYEQIVIVSKKVESIINDQRDEWKKIKVNRNLSDIEILEKIKDILILRYEDVDQIEDLLNYMKCKLTNTDNQDSVDAFRKAISDILPFICNCVDQLNYEEMFEKIVEVVFIRPKNVHKQFGYQMEKIYSSSDEEWARRNAERFSKEFAKDFVIIDSKNMSMEEIRLLVAVACYFQREKERKNNK